jgi:hypothetical protein
MYIRLGAIPVIYISEFLESLDALHLPVHDRIFSPSSVPTSAYLFDCSVLCFHPFVFLLSVASPFSGQTLKLPARLSLE